jgi:hypothetical protein
VLTSILTGIFVNRMPVLWTVLISSALSATAPLLMAFIRTDQVYWENAFFGQVRKPFQACRTYHTNLSHTHTHTRTYT